MFEDYFILCINILMNENLFTKRITIKRDRSPNNIILYSLLIKPFTRITHNSYRD